MASSVGEDFPKEQKRVRDLIEIYASLGPTGVFGKQMLEEILARSERAAIGGDIVAILRSYAELRNCK